MTMHLLPVFVTSTNIRKRPSKSKPTTAHDAWLMKRGLHPDQIRQKKTPDKNWKKSYAEALHVDRSGYHSAGMGNNGSTPKAEPKVYSGELKLLGIATMHKSNMVPVFAKKDAEDISRMRR